jgi:hypothetical protein
MNVTGQKHLQKRGEMVYRRHGVQNEKKGTSSMKSPDFSQYSIALIYNDRILFSSNQPGLGPLLVCIQTYQSCLKGCVLHDRVIGLAEAKLIVYSKIISVVMADVVSERAKAFLASHQIRIEANRIVENVLAMDGKSISPQEIFAMEMDDQASFFAGIRELLRKV